MFEKVRLIQLREFPLNTQEGVEFDSNFLTGTKVGVALRFQYQDTAEDVVAMHVIVSVLDANDGSFVMRTGATMVFAYQGWNEISHDVDTVRTDPTIVNVAHYLIALESGMFFKMMKERIAEGTPILPFLDEDDIIAKMGVEQVS